MNHPYLSLDPQLPNSGLDSTLAISDLLTVDCDWGRYLQEMMVHMKLWGKHLQRWSLLLGRLAHLLDYKIPAP